MPLVPVIAMHGVDHTKILSKTARMFQANEFIYVALPVFGFFLGLGAHYLLKQKKRRDTKHILDINCLICFSQERSIVFYPCKHIAVCEGCARQVHSCPICRTFIQDKIFVEDYIKFKN